MAHVAWRRDRRDVCLLSDLKSQSRRPCFSLKTFVLSQQKKTSCFRRSLSLHVFIGHKLQQFYREQLDEWMDGWSTQFCPVHWIELSQIQGGFQAKFKCWPPWLDEVSHTPTQLSPCDCPRGGSRMPLLRKCLPPQENRKSIMKPYMKITASIINRPFVEVLDCVSLFKLEAFLSPHMFLDNHLIYGWIALK